MHWVYILLHLRAQLRIANNIQPNWSSSKSTWNLNLFALLRMVSCDACGKLAFIFFRFFFLRLSMAAIHFICDVPISIHIWGFVRIIRTSLVARCRSIVHYSICRFIQFLCHTSEVVRLLWKTVTPSPSTILNKFAYCTWLSSFLFPGFCGMCQMRQPLQPLQRASVCCEYYNTMA